jgi:uncharacterized membrane protein
MRLNMVSSPSDKAAEVRCLFTKFIVRIFVDSVWLHKFWGCHRLSERSFFISGRQFHVCARCTGIITGIPFSIALLPFHSSVGVAFLAFALVLFVDGFTQIMAWRKSNNILRFVTGFGAAATLLPSLISLEKFF